jgi:hypothetical protein
MSGGWYQWEGGEYKQRVKEDEGSENIMYWSMKMEKMTPVETISEMGRQRRKGEWWRK